MQASTVGGESETDAIAVAVSPARPDAPAVVTMCTALATWAIASRNAAASGPAASPRADSSVLVIGPICGRETLR
jgi:hypothetical protein